MCDVVIAGRRMGIKGDARIRRLAAVLADLFKMQTDFEWAQVDVFERDRVGPDADGAWATIELPAIKLSVKLVEIFENRTHRRRGGSRWQIGESGELLGVCGEHCAHLVEMTHQTPGRTGPVAAAAFFEATSQLFETSDVGAHLACKILHLSETVASHGCHLLTDDVGDHGFSSIVFCHDG